MSKKILITGKNSFIGTSFREYSLRNKNERFEITELDTHGSKWENFDFKPYDTIFHVAGIAHNSSDPKLKDLYYEVNRDLTGKIAQKAKGSGVSQFIFMSSMIVYGTKGNGRITKETKTNPDNFYGDSKLQAERKILDLEDEKFKVAIVRPPMIYGENAKGNYQLLSKVSKLTPVFPKFDNKRSMLHIDNLNEFICGIIKNGNHGIFHPQNSEYVQTSEMVRLIAKYHNHRVYFTRVFNPIIRLLFRIEIIQKVFGDLYYDKGLSVYPNVDYQLVSLKESIKLSES